MTAFEEVLHRYSGVAGPVLDTAIPREQYTPISMSVHNPELSTVAIADPDACQNYIDKVLALQQAKVAYGGYLEQRNLYSSNPNFLLEGEQLRNVHLGVDFWTKAGTRVLAPIPGTVHSFKNNAVKGDYGPTVILQHDLDGIRCYSLYGHLSLDTLDGLFTAKPIDQGAVLGTLGTPDINVNYAPHLHFQFIWDIGDYQGDYPGVCTTNDVEYFKNNCPNPLLLLRV